MFKFFKLLGYYLILVVFLNIFLKDVSAQGYGEGPYGEGTYNEGQQSSPTPTPVPSSNPGNNNSNSSNNSPGDGGGGCSAQAPSGAPDLFQIDASQKSVTLYITKPGGNVNKYLISYGYDQNVSQFSATINMDSQIWIAPVVINQLAPNTTYFFQAKAVNDCAPGSAASTTIGARTTNNPRSISKYFKNNSVVQKTFNNLKSTVAKSISKPKTGTQTPAQPQAPAQTAPAPAAPQNNTYTPKAPPAQTAPPPQQSGFFSKVVNTVKGWFGF